MFYWILTGFFLKLKKFKNSQYYASVVISFG